MQESQLLDRQVKELFLSEELAEKLNTIGNTARTMSTV
jgi:hypothetical protein